MLKVKIISNGGYSFDEEVFGKVYEAQEDGNHFRVTIHHPHGDSHLAGKNWTYHKSEVELVEEENTTFGVKVLNKNGYALKDTTVGKVYLNATHPAGSRNLVSFVDDVGDEVVMLIDEGIEIIKNSKKSKKIKKKVQPAKLEQTKVHYSYLDGSSYIAKNVTGVVIDVRDNTVAIFSKINNKGAEIKQEVHTDFKDLFRIIVQSPEGIVSYSFKDGLLKQRMEEFYPVKASQVYQH